MYIVYFNNKNCKINHNLSFFYTKQILYNNQLFSLTDSRKCYKSGFELIYVIVNYVIVNCVIYYKYLCMNVYYHAYKGCIYGQQT